MSLSLNQIEQVISIIAKEEPEIQKIVVDIANAVKAIKSDAAPSPAPIPSLPSISNPFVAEIVSFLPQLLALEQKLAPVIAQQ